MQITDTDREELRKLKSSKGWEILCASIDEDIKKKDVYLLSPKVSDVLNDPIKELAIINDEKKQRAFLVWLKNRPDELMNTKIIIWQSI